MATMTYKEQLLHPNWQRRRLQMLEAAGWACSQCEAQDRTLHVHHKRYIKGRMAWEYEDDELQVLCETCHADEHAVRALLERLLNSARIVGSTNLTAVRAYGLLAGYFAGHFAGEIDEELVARAIEIAPGSFCSGVLVAGLVVNTDQKALASQIQKQHVEAGMSMDGHVEHLTRSWLQAGQEDTPL
jgi:hypothetical protein